MKKLIYLALFITSLSLVFTYSSCKKDKKIIKISGSIYDPNTKAYVQGAHITISASKITDGFYNSNYTDIASTTSDAIGVFSFEFDKDKTAGYRFYVYKDKYFDVTKDVNDDDIVAGITYNPQLNIYPEGYISMHVKNNVPINSNDFIAYSYTSGIVQCLGCCTNTTFKGYGTLYDTIIRCKTYGNQDVKVNWHVTKFGNDLAYSDTLKTIAFDTTFYQLYY